MFWNGHMLATFLVSDLLFDMRVCVHREVELKRTAQSFFERNAEVAADILQLRTFANKQQVGGDTREVMRERHEFVRM